MKAGLYTGQVSHTRFRPRRHSFRYWLCMALVPVGENGPTDPRPLFWRLLFPLRTRDHLRGVAVNGGLRTRLSALVRERIGLDPEGDIFLLTGFGLFFHRFNPASFYFCLDAAGAVECLVVEVTNTPWGEQFHYVLDARDQKNAERLFFSCDKTFHVSPFMPMDTRYLWSVATQGETMAIHIGVGHGESTLFTAALDMKRRAFSHRQLIVCLLRQPLMSIQTLVRIHWQAFRLWLKAAPFYPHPRH